MAKTKPIGVRFNQELLNELKEIGVLSPQKALVFLENWYLEMKDDPPPQNKVILAAKNTTNVSEAQKAIDKPATKAANASAVNVKNFNNQPKSDYSINTQKPERLPGEDAIDYAGRVNEWKKLQK